MFFFPYKHWNGYKSQSWIWLIDVIDIDSTFFFFLVSWNLNWSPVRLMKGNFEFMCETVIGSVVWNVFPFRIVCTTTGALDYFMVIEIQLVHYAQDLDKLLTILHLQGLYFNCYREVPCLGQNYTEAESFFVFKAALQFVS